ncbi:MAG TPA: PEGA domain-containing protein [Planctomycetes bacterium]|nr:PEGA domain-containing protein [Planctomycetota bacterium]HIK60214.1 PEGA domain-containing protein [Planctomycetota bacterium]
MHFSSAPAGAAILVDGEDSGFVTPALLDLPDPEDSRIEFVLEGYQTAVRQLDDERQGELVFWSEATTSPRKWNFPLFLPYTDFFFFYKRASASRLEQQVRGRIFVRLRRSSDQQ